MNGVRQFAIDVIELPRTEPISRSAVEQLAQAYLDALEALRNIERLASSHPDLGLILVEARRILGSKEGES